MKTKQQGQDDVQDVQQETPPTLKFKFSFTKPDDMDKELNNAIIAFAKEHHLSASQSTCCGASKGSKGVFYPIAWQHLAII
ncbi:MAG TPA: hypothetical protein PLD95_04780 [bacterium]|jgi:hypothetical protein|nr:hypothetical protein [bacterium]HQI03589.1 hypothetical protein [bacterium]